MLRKIFLTLVTTSVVAFCCTKSEEREAQRAAGGLMPSAMPAYEPEYIADQVSVKTLPVRKISYEPLARRNSHRRKAARMTLPRKSQRVVQESAEPDPSRRVHQFTQYTCNIRFTALAD